MGACYSENRDDALYFEEVADNELLLQNPEAAIVYLERAITIVSAKSSPDDEKVGRLYQKLADISNGRLNSYETIDFYEKALSILTPLYTEYDIRIELMCEKIAHLYWEDKRFTEAILYYKKLLRIRKKMYGDSALEVADIYQRIGEAFEQNENFTEAAINFEMSIEIKKKFPKAKSSLGLSYQNLGIFYLESLQNFQKAKSMFEQCIQLYKADQTTKESLSDICLCLFKLGETKFRMGDLRSAKKDIEQALKLAKESQWEDKSQALSMQMNGYLLLAGVCEVLNNSKDMYDAEKSWIILQFQDLHLSDYEMSYLYYSLGCIYFKLEQYDLAISELENSIVYAKLSKQTEYEQIRIAIILSRIYTNKGDFEAAKKQLELIGEFFFPDNRRKFPEDNLLYKRASANLQIKNNEAEAGINKLKDIASVCEQVLGEGNHHTRSVNFELAKAMKYTGDYEGALAVFKKLSEGFANSKVDFKPPSNDARGDVVDVEGLLIDVGPFHELPKLGPTTWMNELEKAHFRDALFGSWKVGPSEKEVTREVKEIQQKRGVEDENEHAKTFESNGSGNQ